MRHSVEPQSRLKQLPIKLQELAGISGASIGDDKADVEIVSGGGELPDEILPREIKHDDSMLHTITFANFGSGFIKKCLSPRHKHNIDSRSRNLTCELPTDARRCAGDECPWAELFIIKGGLHCSFLCCVFFRGLFPSEVPAIRFYMTLDLCHPAIDG